MGIVNLQLVFAKMYKIIGIQTGGRNVWMVYPTSHVQYATDVNGNTMYSITLIDEYISPIYIRFVLKTSTK